jgi:hypothetical protein
MTLPVDTAPSGTSPREVSGVSSANGPAMVGLTSADPLAAVSVPLEAASDPLAASSDPLAAGDALVVAGLSPSGTPSFLDDDEPPSSVFGMSVSPGSDEGATPAAAPTPQAGEAGRDTPSDGQY